MMNRRFWLIGMTAALLSLGVAHARDEYKMRPIEAALKSDEAKSKLDPRIRLFFGKQAHPKIASKIRETTMKRSTISPESDDFDPCVHTFVRAMMDFQERARAAGADAAVNIVSNYKNKEVSSETEYTCVSGSMVTAVAFKGGLVKLAE
jgi:hypothetical protein